MNKKNNLKSTFFASPERSSEETLKQEIKLISHNPFMDQLLRAVSGILAVLNKNRQIISVNDALLDQLGYNDISEVIGLRPGEAIHCIHSHDEPGGCGTGKACASCGAAIAIVTAMATGQPVEKICVASTLQVGKAKDIFFNVRAVSVKLEQEELILLFLKDMTREQNLAILERSFFHDISNTITALSGSVQVYETGQHSGHDKFLERVKTISSRLFRELEIQKLLLMGKELKCYPGKIQISKLFHDISNILETHESARNKKIIFPDLGGFETFKLYTDEHILFRILINMLLNALEASSDPNEVSLGFKAEHDCYEFSVWNKEFIPEEIALRIFQRNFSTKSHTGRGLGTYSMKLFAENYLNGQVDFISTPNEGTTFYLRLPFKH